jgi:tripeptidyl-peptidase-1
VYESLSQSYSPTDLKHFQKYFNLPIETISNDIGGHDADDACERNDGEDCVEANLDVQYLMAVSQSTPTTFYYWGSEDFLLEWIKEVSGMKNPPLVFSISYGVDESEVSSSYIDSFNIEALKLAARGVTIVVASGDDGAAGANARQNPIRCGYFPDFPSSSPYVTSVGGTMVLYIFFFFVFFYLYLFKPYITKKIK